MRFNFAKYSMFQFQLFRRGFNNQVGIRDLSQMSGSANMLQSRIAISFSKFSDLYSFSKIPLNRLNAPGERISINIAQQNFIVCGCSHLGNSVAHGACAYDADGFNCLRSDACVQSFALVSI